MVTLENKGGSISITSEVFTNIAGDAATKCFGVKGMAGKNRESGRFMLLRRESISKGVSVSFEDDGSANIALHIVIDHGVNIAAVGRSIMNEVSYKVSQATGVPVNRVDVFVDTMILDD